MDIWKHEVILAALVVSTGSLLLTSLLRPRIMPSGEMKQRGPQVKFRVLLKDNAVGPLSAVCESVAGGACRLLRLQCDLLAKKSAILMPRSAISGRWAWWRK
ncbi:Uncharacterised protein [Morganella morganii]|nr:Uncharacterised protein [Morganella morganii]